MIVSDQLHRAARLYGDQPAAICGDEARSFAEIEERSNRLANALLATGLQTGDRVATWLENSIRCIEVDFALAKAGLVRASLNPRLTAGEANFILNDADAKVLIHGASFDAHIEAAALAVPSLALKVRAAEDTAATPRSADTRDYEELLASGRASAPGVRFDPEHLYCLFYTSGTTGRPKGVMLSHRAILNIGYNMLMELGPISIGEKVLLMQPLTHGAGFFVLPQFIKGGCSVIMRHFDPQEMLRLAQLHEVEVIKLIPTMLQRVLRVPALEAYALPKLRAILYGASPMPEQPLREAVRVFGPGKLAQIYGQSEAAVTIGILPAAEHRLDNPWPARLTSAGRPWTTVQVRVVDEHGQDVAAGEIGELIVSAPHVMSGYWKRPELTAQAIRGGWLFTNDLSRIDEHGYIYLLGRKDEMIISGGYNIAPREIEDVLYEHASVQEVAVIGEADAEWGQAVVAYVSLRDDKANADELLEFGRGRLGFKRPKRVYLVRELPKNAAGKIQKSALNPSLALDADPAVRAP